MTTPTIEPSATDTESGLGHELQRAARNLLALEVNTIFKENITATRMPSVAHALIDIVNDYDTLLRRLEAVVGAPESGKASHEVFDRLRTRASEIVSGKPGVRSAGVDYPQSKLLMVCRVRDNCDQLKNVFDSLQKRTGTTLTFTRDAAPNVMLLPVEMMTVRKIWEIGTEEIAMQTVIQLDGDIVTRLQREYARAKDDPLVAIHQSSVATAVGTWNRLVDTLGAFISGAARLFLGKAK